MQGNVRCQAGCRGTRWGSEVQGSVGSPLSFLQLCGHLQNWKACWRVCSGNSSSNLGHAQAGWGGSQVCGRRRICEQAGPASKQGGTFWLSGGRRSGAPASCKIFLDLPEGRHRQFCLVPLLQFLRCAVLSSAGWPGEQNHCQGLLSCCCLKSVPTATKTSHAMSCRACRSRLRLPRWRPWRSREQRWVQLTRDLASAYGPGLSMPVSQRHSPAVPVHCPPEQP